VSKPFGGAVVLFAGHRSEIPSCAARLLWQQKVKRPAPVRLQQVIVNLISNSSKFSPAGDKIWLKATVDGDKLVLHVEDKGKGIPPELIPRIFDLFTQAHTEGDSAGQGLGLGLGLVKSIVEMHGGTVQAKSEGDDMGAEIIVRLPLRQPTAGAAAL
jgi:signal transduction histidine kinase